VKPELDEGQMQAKDQTLRGTVRTGRGASGVFMRDSGMVEQMEKWTGMKVIPGTLNVTLDSPIDITRAMYVSLTRMGMEMDVSQYGIENEG